MGIEQLVILGSGPAGFTAAVYAARANLQPLLVEGIQPGGQLMITSEVENFPGFPDGIQGPELMDLMRRQAEKFGTRLVSDEATAVDLSRRPFSIEVSAGTIQARSLIIATGARARRLGIPTEEALFGRGVSACATCDGFFFRGKDVLVVGGGDTAVEEALYLSRVCNSVKLIHRRDQLRASRLMESRVRSTPNVSFEWNAVVTECLDPALGRFTAARVRDVKTGAEKVLPADGLFVAIGHTPATDLFAGKLTLDEAGYIVVEPGTPRTSIEGVFAAGDVADPHWRQAVSAAGTGCMAALAAERFLAAESG